MSCPGYNPRFQKQLNPNDPRGPENCLCYAAAMAGDYSTCGAKVPTGKNVRILTGDISGGTTLTEVDDALRQGYGIDLDVRYRMPRAAFWAEVDKGRAAVIYVDYSAFLGTQYAGSTTFGGTHGITVTSSRRFDPLSDGRRGLCNDGPSGKAVPRSLIDKAMDGLKDDHGRVIGKQGNDRFSWAGFTRDNEPGYTISIPKGKKYGVYFLQPNGRIRARGTLTATKVITGSANGPTRRLIDQTTPTGKRLAVIVGGKSIPIIAVTSGQLKGKYINSQFARPT